MDVYRVELSKKAKRDLQEIHAYISVNLREPALAEKILDKVEAAIITLRQMPKRYALERDELLRQRNLRKLAVDNYLLFYIVHDKTKTVYIARALYARRDWVNFL
ncbi:MAG: type II toxin-antitoxin system RelE/ParE family toxin [Clostridiales bacterium]|nr:type II toxin-antitoxin system RelE/ParE family toxin [Clostridiales bacterium]